MDIANTSFNVETRDDHTMLRHSDSFDDGKGLGIGDVDEEYEKLFGGLDNNADGMTDIMKEYFFDIAIDESNTVKSTALPEKNTYGGIRENAGGVHKSIESTDESIPAKEANADDEMSIRLVNEIISGDKDAITKYLWENRSRNGIQSSIEAALSDLDQSLNIVDKAENSFFGQDDSSDSDLREEDMYAEQKKYMARLVGAVDEKDEHTEIEISDVDFDEFPNTSALVDISVNSSISMLGECDMQIAMEEEMDRSSFGSRNSAHHNRDTSSYMHKYKNEDQQLDNSQSGVFTQDNSPGMFSRYSRSHGESIANDFSHDDLCDAIGQGMDDDSFSMSLDSKEKNDNYSMANEDLSMANEDLSMTNEDPSMPHARKHAPDDSIKNLSSQISELKRMLNEERRKIRHLESEVISVKKGISPGNKDGQGYKQANISLPQSPGFKGYAQDIYGELCPQPIVPTTYAGTGNVYSDPRMPFSPGRSSMYTSRYYPTMGMKFSPYSGRPIGVAHDDQNYDNIIQSLNNYHHMINQKTEGLVNSNQTESMGIDARALDMVDPKDAVQFLIENDPINPTIPQVGTAIYACCTVEGHIQEVYPNGDIVFRYVTSNGKPSNTLCKVDARTKHRTYIFASGQVERYLNLRWIFSLIPFASTQDTIYHEILYPDGRHKYRYISGKEVTVR